MTAKKRVKKAPAKRAKNRTPRGRFLKGRSGNPSGRPKGAKELRTRILEDTKDGKEITTFFLRLMRNTKARMKDRSDAAEWLSDRAWGKVTQLIGGDPDAPLPVFIVRRDG